MFAPTGCSFCRTNGVLTRVHIPADRQNQPVNVHTTWEPLKGFSWKLVSKYFMKLCRLTSRRIYKVKSRLCLGCTYSVKCSALPKHDFEAALQVPVSQQRSYNQASSTEHVTNRRRTHLLSNKWKYTFNIVEFTSFVTAFISLTVLLTQHRKLASTHRKPRSNKTANAPRLLHKIKHNKPISNGVLRIKVKNLDICLLFPPWIGLIIFIQWHHTNVQTCWEELLVVR